jgi:uncharacterized protein
MFLSIKEMELRKIRFDATFPPGKTDFLDGRVRQASPLHVEGSAELVSRTLGEIRVRGCLSVRLETECDRCLEVVAFPIETDFDLFYEPMTLLSAEEEVKIDEGESEIAFYEGDGLDLEDILRERVLLALPMQKICRQDCKGICPICGQNRNQVACGCQAKMVDDRWAALKKLR